MNTVHDHNEFDCHESGSPGSVGLSLRTRVAAHRGRLTRELSEGADPASSPELALRAAQLTSHSRRRQLAQALQRAIREAHDPPRPAYAVIINRRAVLAAEGAITGLIARLCSAKPVRAQGMAIAERMITNAEESPLYSSDEPEALRRRVLVALEALDAVHREERELSPAA